jgi:hypothetical protein
VIVQNLLSSMVQREHWVLSESRQLCHCLSLSLSLVGVVFGYQGTAAV